MEEYFYYLSLLFWNNYYYVGEIVSKVLISNKNCMLDLILIQPSFLSLTFSKESIMILYWRSSCIFFHLKMGIKDIGIRWGILQPVDKLGGIFMLMSLSSLLAMGLIYLVLPSSIHTQQGSSSHNSTLKTVWCTCLQTHIGSIHIDFYSKECVFKRLYLYSKSQRKYVKICNGYFFKGSGRLLLPWKENDQNYIIKSETLIQC